MENQYLPLPEPMVTKFYDAIGHRYATMSGLILARQEFSTFERVIRRTCRPNDTFQAYNLSGTLQLDRKVSNTGLFGTE